MNDQRLAPLTCTCGATCSGTTGERRRFAARHPACCNARSMRTDVARKLSRELAGGTRCVDDATGDAVRPKHVNSRVGMV